ncbi:hypothetical protein Tco_0180242 [Tanacetum coccineum]
MGKHPGELISSLPTLSTDDLLLANIGDRRIPRPSSLVEKLAHLILYVSRACLNYNPQERPTMCQVTELLSVDDGLWMKMHVSDLHKAHSFTVDHPFWISLIKAFTGTDLKTRIEYLFTNDLYDNGSPMLLAQADAIELYFISGYRRLAKCKASVSSEGLAECKASTSNLTRIQVKHIVKEVEDYLKTYSSAGMDISWDGRLVCRRNMLMVLRRVRGGNTLTILSPFEEQQAELKLFSMKGLGET